MAQERSLEVGGQINPVMTNCESCHLPAAGNDILKCSVCGGAHHSECVGASLVHVIAFRKLENLFPITCRKCMEELQEYKKERSLAADAGQLIVDLKHQIDRMKNLLDGNQAARSAPPRAGDPSLPHATLSWAGRVAQGTGQGLQLTMPPNQPATSTFVAPPQPPSPRTYAKIFHKETLEIEKMERSIIVSGLKKSRTHTDEASIVEICQDGLGLEARHKIASAQRIGRIWDDRVQNLLVTFTEKSLQQSVLRYARELREDSKFDGIYLNPSLTTEKQILGYNKRLFRRQQQNRSREVEDLAPPPSSPYHQR